MSWLADWGLFAGVMALGQFSPGPDMILLTRVSLRNGRKAGWLVMLGIVVGLCLHSALAIGGMSALLGQGGWFERGLCLAAAAYLGYLGWQMVRVFFIAHYGEIQREEQRPSGQPWFLQGLLCNVLNPKVVVFFAGMTAVFLKGERPVFWPVLLWATIVLEGMVLWGLWVLLLQKKTIRDFYQKQGKWLELSFGLGLWVLAILLVVRAF